MALLHLALGVMWVSSCRGYFGDWSSLGGRPNEPTCVDIPRNMSLCSDIDYDKMRLPNLLNHDTLAEVLQQAGSWVPLLNVRCHKETKLFLCSLFTPVCLQNQIFPCRSLCQAVQIGCEARMKTYGYDWPSMFDCGRFPLDNDMCIKSFDSQETDKVVKDDYCSVCSPVDTYENILDNYCRSDFVIIARIKRQRKSRIKHRNVKIFKSQNNRKAMVRRSKMTLDGESSCCSFVPGKQKYLIMGKQDDLTLKPTFILPWRKTKNLRKAARSFDSLDCQDPNLFSSSLAEGKIVPKSDNPAGQIKKGKRKGRKKRKKKNKNNTKEDTQKKKKRNRKERRKNKRKNAKKNGSHMNQDDPVS